LNDRSQPQLQISITGKILQIVNFEPAQVRLSGLAGSALSGEVTLSAGTPLGIEVTGAKALKQQCEVEGIDPLGDGTYRLRVTAAPAQLPGMLRDIVEVDVVTTDGKDHKTQIPIIIDHMDRISMAPRGNIVFQRRDTDRLKQAGAPPVRRDIQLYSSTPEIHFTVTGAEILDVPEGVFETDLRTVKEGERYIVSVLVREYRDDPSIRGRLVIHTDDPEMPDREVRLYAQFGATPTQQPNPAVGQQLRPGTNSGTVIKGQPQGAQLHPKLQGQPPEKTPGTGQKETDPHEGHDHD
jgi:hypothetical protein